MTQKVVDLRKILEESVTGLSFNNKIEAGGIKSKLASVNVIRKRCNKYAVTLGDAKSSSLLGLILTSIANGVQPDLKHCTDQQLISLLDFMDNKINDTLQLYGVNWDSYKYYKEEVLHRLGGVYNLRKGGCSYAGDVDNFRQMLLSGRIMEYLVQDFMCVKVGDLPRYKDYVGYRYKNYGWYTFAVEAGCNLDLVNPVMLDRVKDKLFMLDSSVGFRLHNTKTKRNTGVETYCELRNVLRCKIKEQ